MPCGENLSVSGYGAVSRVWASEGPKTLDFWLVTGFWAEMNFPTTAVCNDEAEFQTVGLPAYQELTHYAFLSPSLQQDVFGDSSPRSSQLWRGQRAAVFVRRYCGYSICRSGYLRIAAVSRIH